MPGPQPYCVTLSDKQREILEHLMRRQTSSQRLIRRAKTVLAAAEGASNESISVQLGLDRNTVRTWRQLVYTPKHTSWLNQVEIWFSILVRRLLKRASFTSVQDLHDRVLTFIEYFNTTLAKPFKWTYKGRPLSA
jgi:transposase